MELDAGNSNAQMQHEPFFQVRIVAKIETELFIYPVQYGFYQLPDVIIIQSRFTIVELFPRQEALSQIKHLAKGQIDGQLFVNTVGDFLCRIVFKGNFQFLSQTRRNSQGMAPL